MRSQKGLVTSSIGCNNVIILEFPRIVWSANKAQFVSVAFAARSWYICVLCIVYVSSESLFWQCMQYTYLVYAGTHCYTIFQPWSYKMSYALKRLLKLELKKRWIQQSVTVFGTVKGHVSTTPHVWYCLALIGICTWSKIRLNHIQLNPKTLTHHTPCYSHVLPCPSGVREKLVRGYRTLRHTRTHASTTLQQRSRGPAEEPAKDGRAASSEVGMFPCRDLPRPAIKINCVSDMKSPSTYNMERIYWLLGTQFVSFYWHYSTDGRERYSFLKRDIYSQRFTRQNAITLSALELDFYSRLPTYACQWP